MPRRLDRQVETPSSATGEDQQQVLEGTKSHFLLRVIPEPLRLQILRWACWLDFDRLIRGGLLCSRCLSQKSPGQHYQEFFDAKHQANPGGSHPSGLGFDDTNRSVTARSWASF